MKKAYIKPATIEVNFRTEGMIAASIGFGDDKVNADQALTNKKNPIWGGEEEETSGGIW
jgi:hypothetical protein